MRRLASPARLVTILVFLFLYLPIGTVIVKAFNADETLVRWGGFTTDWIRDAFTSERVRQDFLNSVTIAVLATVISVVISMGAVMASSRLPRRASGALRMLTYARLMLPEVVIAAGILLVIQRLGLSTGLWSVVAGHVVFCSAYATLVLQARMASITGVYDEAAADLGARPWRAFMRVLLPMMAPAIIVAALLSFTFSYDDVVSTLFLADAHTETLPVLILGLTRHGVSPQINAIAVAFMFVSLLMMIGTIILTARPRRRSTVNIQPNGASDDS